MYIFSSSKWIEHFIYPFKRFEDIPNEVFNDINNGLENLQSENPLVSIIISAWNEEVDILKTVGSLSKQKTNIPIEIIVVNNNSTDNTQFTINKLQVKTYFQPILG
jgi:cellulose synthase/poly-beta-1,6-N-acetylglucosamine synthase-like glycosyltransferase